jgi:hypothetical protein
MVPYQVTSALKLVLVRKNLAPFVSMLGVQACNYKAVVWKHLEMLH